MILITGASGNVGKEVLKQITQTGVEVRAAFQSPSKAAGIPSGVDIVSLHYNRAETLQTALKGVNRVFLVGPPVPPVMSANRKESPQTRFAHSRYTGSGLNEYRSSAERCGMHGTFSITPIQSSRSNIAGSIESARCAGIHVATNPSNAIATTTPANTNGSRGVA